MNVFSLEKPISNVNHFMQNFQPIGKTLIMSKFVEAQAKTCFANISETVPNFYKILKLGYRIAGMGKFDRTLITHYLRD